MNETGKGFRISAWGAAGLLAGYSATLTLALQWYYSTANGRHSVGLGWGPQTLLNGLFYLVVLSGVLSLARLRPEHRKWLAIRASILVTVGVLDRPVLLYLILPRMRIEHWMFSQWLFSNTTALIFVILAPLLFPIRRVRQASKVGGRVPLVTMQYTLSIRLWFVIIVAIIIPSLISFAYRTVGFMPFAIAVSILRQVIQWGFIAYMLTRLAEWSIYQQQRTSTSPSPVPRIESADPLPESSVE